MKLNLLRLMMAAVIVLSACKPSHDKKHWSYEGGEGPAHWGEMGEEFAACKIGRIQSPVDIAGAKDGDTQIEFAYRPVPFKVADNSHTIQANLESGNTIQLDGKEYKLLQIHFHAPSENHLDGKSFPMEGHLVHRADDGSLAVVGVFFSGEGSANTGIAEIWKSMPQQVHGEQAGAAPLDLSLLLPSDRTMFHFDGSLTTPPCSEGVRWNVFREVVPLSQDQIDRFVARYSNNARPVQPLNDRKLTLSR